MHNRALSDVRFASSAGEARCPGSQPGASPQAPLPARLPTQAAQPGAPAYLAAGCQRSGGASSASPPRLLHRSERHVPGLCGRTPGNYYGLGRGKGGGCQREGMGGRAAAFYSPPKPPPATEHAQLPGFAPRRTFHERTQLFRVFAAAGGRQAVAAAVGGGGESGGVSPLCGARSREKAASCQASHPAALPRRRGSSCTLPPHTLGVRRNFVRDQCGAEPR